MTAVSETPDRLAVIRSVTLKSRRGEMPERTVTATDLWRLPEWTVVKHPGRSPKKHEKQWI